MTSIDTLIQFGAQVPLVIIFIWFVLRLLDRFDKNLEKRDREWRDFLSEQREQYNIALGRLAEELKGMNMNVTTVKELMYAHDQKVTAALPVMQTIGRERRDRPREE